MTLYKYVVTKMVFCMHASTCMCHIVRLHHRNYKRALPDVVSLTLNVSGCKKKTSDLESVGDCLPEFEPNQSLPLL